MGTMIFTLETNSSVVREIEMPMFLNGHVLEKEMEREPISSLTDLEREELMECGNPLLIEKLPGSANRSTPPPRNQP